jgi:Concanavalin A-like lectin/glucanases superfamily
MLARPFKRPSRLDFVLPSQVDVTNGLIAWFTSYGARGVSDRIYDISGNNLIGTLGSAVKIAASPFGNCFITNGTSGATGTVICTASVSGIVPPITYTAWINPDPTSQAIYVFAQNGTAPPGLMLNAANTIGFTRNGTVLQSTTATIVPGTWSHIATTCDGLATSNIRIYINGITQKVATSVTTFTTSGTLQLGNPVSTTGRLIQMADMREYNRVLSPSEIFAVYMQGLMAAHVEPQILRSQAAAVRRGSMLLTGL